MDFFFFIFISCTVYGYCVYLCNNIFTNSIRIKIMTQTLFFKPIHKLQVLYKPTHCGHITSYNMYVCRNIFNCPYKRDYFDIK